MKSFDGDWRWRAVVSRTDAFDGMFYFAVRTTGVFCRPSCRAKHAKRENVTFFSSAAEAELAGFRACLKCRPNEAGLSGPSARLAATALALIFDPETEITTVEDLSGRLNSSAGRLQKAFREVLGINPKEVIDMARLEDFKEHVKTTDVTTSLYESGFGSSRSLYEKAGERLGMTPAVYKKGGKDLDIDYTIVDSPLGKLLIAATARGICAVSFGEEETSLKDELEQEFFAARIQQNDGKLKAAATAILKGLEGERAILNLPLDIRASAFQMRVWSELRKIPYGETRSYAEIAESIGDRKAVRAVARACATNPVALVNPCHRVIASDGKLSGYRWGIDRKRRLLDNERNAK
ncbi:MAG: bifunctional DNA-binding transcriptional regulator/O6-methylguanine-DNA methyltransferase Ada [Acidobacteriota bacterium]